MITIYLCDDNEVLRRSYRDLIKQIADTIGELITFREFGSGDSLIFSLQDNPNKADIIYLDIMMPGMNGIDIAKTLRSYGCNSELIFLTSSEEYVLDSFDVFPTYYLLKNVSNTTKFKNVLIHAIENSKNKKVEYFTCKNGALGKRIPIANILYFEIINRIVTVHFDNESFDFYSNLCTLEKKLQDKPFIRIHRSFLVNIHVIDSISQNSLRLANGEELPIGRSYHADVQETLFRYLAQSL